MSSPNAREDVGASIADSYRANPQSEDDDALAMANAVAATDEEDWSRQLPDL